LTWLVRFGAAAEAAPASVGPAGGQAGSLLGRALLKRQRPGAHARAPEPESSRPLSCPVVGTLVLLRRRWLHRPALAATRRRTWTTPRCSQRFARNLASLRRLMAHLVGVHSRHLWFRVGLAAPKRDLRRRRLWTSSVPCGLTCRATWGKRSARHRAEAPARPLRRRRLGLELARCGGRSPC
jgi:hypothetical protein